MARMLAKKLLNACLLGLLVMGAACNDGAGGPAPCEEDAECMPICEAACAADPLVSATCDDFLRACICECETREPDAGV